MLVIREAQLRAFGQVTLRVFRKRLAEHLRRTFPDLCAGLAGEEFAAAIDHGIGRARAHELTAERDVVKYVTLAFALGLDFDRDPGLPWAARLLDPESGRAARLRIEFLYAKAVEVLRERPELTVRRIEVPRVG